MSHSYMYSVHTMHTHTRHTDEKYKTKKQKYKEKSIGLSTLLVVVVAQM